jgi:hypothetical protein
MKRVMEARKRLWALVFAIAIGAGAGALSVTPVGACEEDECEGGTTCAQNTGYATQCNMSGSSCQTKACI